MTSRFPIKTVAILALAIGLVEGWLCRVRGGDDVVLLPLAVATMASVVFAALGLDALVRRGTRPDRDDIGEVIALQRRIDTRLDEADARLTRTNDTLFLMVMKPTLSTVDRALAAATERVERWEQPTTDLAAWSDAMDHWSAAVSRIDPALAPDPSAATAQELQSARERLPMTRNFSSENLKAATAYYVRSDRLAAARTRLDGHIRTALETIDRTAPMGQPG